MPPAKRLPLTNGFAGSLATLCGSAFVTRITDTDPTRAPLRIGAQVWSTHDLARLLGIVHTRAARLVSAAAASINARSVADLYKRSSPYTFAGIEGLGETSLYVLWRVFEAEGLDPEAWATAGDTDAALVSFHSLKKREQAAAARTRGTARGRRRPRSR